MLNRCRTVIRIDLNDIVVSFLFLLQDLQCFLSVARSDHTIRYLTFNQHRSIAVANIRECNKITERRHTVCTSCSRVGTCQRRKFTLIVHPVDLRKCLIKWKSNCRSCRGNMFERSRRRKTCRLFQLLYQLPAIESIQKVDIARTAAQYLNRQI